MIDLKKYARGKECQIRLEKCMGEHEGNCICHWRDSSTGCGKKENDLIAAHGCFYCHGVVDGRIPIPKGMTWREVREAHKDGIIRTLQVLSREGII